MLAFVLVTLMRGERYGCLFATRNCCAILFEKPRSLCYMFLRHHSHQGALAHSASDFHQAASLALFKLAHYPKQRQN
jgi:hypothetical protein